MADEHRKRMKRLELSHARFLTFSCQHRLPLFRPAALADVFAHAMERALAEFMIDLHAWVIMPEHVHLLVSARDASGLVKALIRMKQATAQRAIARWRELDAPILGRIADPQGRPRFWLKGGGFDRSIRDEHEFIKTVQYIHRNPVTRELVSTPAEWRWSSVRWWMGRRDDEIACVVPPSLATWRGFQ